MRLISPMQIRGARAMLDWSMVDLAKAAGVSVSAVKRFEDGQQFPGSEDALRRVQATLEEAGVEFMVDGDDSPGLRLRLR